MVFFFWDVWQSSGKSSVDNGGERVAMAATVPFYSCFHREVCVKAVQPSCWQKKLPLALHKGVG